MIASETPGKRHKTVVDLEKELEEQCTIIASLEACLCVQSRCISHTNKRVLKLEHNSTAATKRVKALEHPKK
jgi:hypothetical protein